ncbi:DUF3618 domain-containing protein [Nonomuraea candida]|uniref:DUF3618 domain-containing protein n=1 Tax=Nonomuraea candida TaxID=359159 RepID=UPI00069469E6|nr:DUF3618 domain-containing protein [Nonomuraea candida]
MSETDPGYSEQSAGNVGAHRATVGTPTEHESINVPPTRAGAADNARRAEAAREGHETFIPETPIPDERSEATDHLRTEEDSMQGPGGRTREHATEETRGHTGAHSAEKTRGRTGGRTDRGSAARSRGLDEDEGDEDDVRRDIAETRRQMGETVSALAQKADVKSRAGHAAETAKERASHAAEAARDRASHAAETAKERAADAAETVRHKASEVAGKVREGTPDQVKGAATKARKRPVLLIATVGAVIVFAVRRMRRRRMTR